MQGDADTPQELTVHIEGMWYQVFDSTFQCSRQNRCLRLWGILCNERNLNFSEYTHIKILHAIYATHIISSGNGV